LFHKWQSFTMTRVTQFLNPNSFTLRSSLTLCHQHSSLTLYCQYSFITLYRNANNSSLTLYRHTTFSHSLHTKFLLLTFNFSQPHHIDLWSCFYILISHFLGFFRSVFGFPFTVYPLCFFYHLWSSPMRFSFCFYGLFVSFCVFYHFSITTS